MQISQNSWKKYSKRQEQIRNKAAAAMKSFIALNGIENRADVVAYANALITRYGEAAAAYACQMYDEIAEASKANVKPAEPAEISTYSQIAKAINGSLLQGVAGLMAVRVVERMVKQAGADTILQNAIRDGAEYAWIPDGGACPFCMGIGAEGWKRASQRIVNGGHAEHIHSSCNCEFAVRFDEKSNVNGYNPNDYKKALEEQSDKEIREEQREENRDLINEQKREAYEFNKDNEDA